MTWRCAQTNTLFLSTDISILSLAKKWNYDKHTKKRVCCQLLILQEKKSHTVGWGVCVCMCVGSVLQHSHTRWGISPSLWPLPMPLPFMSCLVCLQAFSGVGSLFFWPLDQPSGAITATFCTMLKKKKANDLSSKIHQRKCGALNCFAKVSPFRCRFNVFSYYYLYQSLCYALLTSSHLKPIGKMFLPRIKTSKECQFL